MESVVEHKGDHIDHGEIEQAEEPEYGEESGPLDSSVVEGEENAEGDTENTANGEGSGEYEEPTGEAEVEAGEEERDDLTKSREDIEQEELTKAIFGDSEDEDNFDIPEPTEYNKESGGEDEDYAESAKKLKRLVKQRNRRKGSDEEDEEEEGEPETKKKKKRLSKKKRNAIPEDDEEGAVEGEKKKKKKKKKKQQPEGGEGGEAVEGGEAPVDDGNDSDGPVRKRRVDEGDMPEFDAAMSRLRHKRPKKDLSVEESEALDTAAADFVIKMEAAAELDVDANRASQPATNKVAILPKVVDLLNKTRFAGAFVGKGGFAAIRKWLEPLPDKSLPSLNIREQLLDILFKLPFDTDQLKDSEVGKVVMFLWKAQAETQKNKRQCAKIIEKWSRPIFGLGTGYHSHRHDDEDLDRPSSRRRKEEEETEVDKRTREQMKDNRKFHARIPQRIFMDFKKMPTNNEAKQTSTLRNPHIAAAEADKVLKKKRKGKPSSVGGKVLRAEKISVEGRMTK